MIKILISMEVACGPQYRSKAMKSEKIDFKWKFHIRCKGKADGKRLALEG